MNSRCVLVDADGGNGGPQHMLIACAEVLRSHGRDVLVAAPEGWLVNAAQAKRFAVICLGPKAPDAVGRARMAVRFMQDSRRSTGVVFANGVSALHVVGPAVLRFRLSVRLLFHDSRMSDSSRRGLALWKRLMPSLRAAAVSGYSLGLIQSVLGGRASSIVPNIVSPGQRLVHASRSRVGIGFIGSGDPNKGLDVFCRVVGGCQQLPAEWHVVGVRDDQKTPFVDACRKALAPVGHVRWWGRLPAIEGVWSELDIVMVPSWRESFSRVALEAMSRGVVVVASDVPGMREIVVDGLTGVTFPAGDAKAAARKIEDLIADTTFRQRLSDAGVRYAASYSPDAVWPRLERFLESG